MKKLRILNLIWAGVILLGLWYQAILIRQIVLAHLFPSWQMIRPLIDGEFQSYYINQIATAILWIVIVVMVEIILFMVINLLLARWNRRFHVGILTKWSCYGMILSLLLMVVLMLGFSYQTILRISEYASIQQWNQTKEVVNQLTEELTQTEWSSLGHLVGFVEKSSEMIRTDPVLNGFVQTTVDYFEYVTKLYRGWTLVVGGLAMVVILDNGLWLYREKQGKEIENVI